MGFRNFLSMYSRYYLLFPIMLILGIVLGIILPHSFSFILSPIADTLTRIMLYITKPYFFFALIITTYELASINQLKDVLKNLIGTALLLHVSIVLVGVILFLFLPAQNLIPLTRSISTIPDLSFEKIVSEIFPDNWLQVFSFPSLIPLLVLAIIIGLSAQQVVPHNHVFIEFIKGIRKIIANILQITLPFFTIAVVILAVDRIEKLRSLEFLHNFLAIISLLTIFILILLFVVFPLLFSILRIPVYLGPWLRKLVPAISVSFASGSVVAAGGLLMHTEIINNPRKKIIDTSVSLSFIFARVGVALVTTLTYALLFKSFYAHSIDILQILVLITLSICISFISELLPSSIIIVGIVTISHIEFISIQEFYVIIIAFIPILMSFAAAIDALCFGFLQLYVKHSVISKHAMPFSAQQDDDTV